MIVFTEHSSGLASPGQSDDDKIFSDKNRSAVEYD